MTKVKIWGGQLESCLSTLLFHKHIFLKVICKPFSSISKYSVSKWHVIRLNALKDYKRKSK